MPISGWSPKHGQFGCDGSPFVPMFVVSIEMMFQSLGLAVGVPVLLVAI